NDRANHALGYLESIANKVNDAQLFATICQDIVPSFGLETTSSLINANKVSDLHQIIKIRQGAVPTIGSKATSSLLIMVKDFQEFERYLLRVTATLKWWRFNYQDVFHEIQNTSEANRILTFLETLTNDPRMTKFTSQTNQPNHLHLVRNEVQKACLGKAWKKTSEYDIVVDKLVYKIEENMVHTYLGTAWRPIDNIRWQFDRFTEYVP
ncbi:MAG: hypothetical protein GY816_20435, partial [Cytophagales bacterium]|nr:hypothetical protein [Cytophagales bacterium]